MCSDIVLPHQLTGLKHHLMSWQAVRDLQPSVQTFLFERFRARAESNASQNKVNVPECFVLASFYMNGYGTQPDLTKAQHLILHAAANGHLVSQAYIWRIFKATGTELPINERYLATLENRAFSGSRAALHDLAIIAPERLDRVKKILKMGHAGVGASFWANDLIHGFNFAQWMNSLRDPPVLIKNLEGLSDIAGYRVNKRGDRILHIAASCGHPQAVEALLDKFPALMVNQLNDAGETPLLSACRSGHREVVEVLMKRGADPTIVTSSHESPLHWLISFEEDEMEGFGQVLLSKGADVWSSTSTATKYSEFPSGIDLDSLPPGTPLTWAVQQDRPDIVRFLIRAAGTARICVGNSNSMLKEWANKPMEWAAHYHYRECLEVMITAMKEEKIGFTYMDFLRAATHSADRFSMVLRNGTSYVDRFTDTMNYLLEETHGAAFGTGIGGFGYNLLYYAISEAHDLVVEYLLSPETAELLQAGWERLKKAAKDESDIPIRQYGVYSLEHVSSPCGNEQRTPLLECVRWNRCGLFDLLISKGADIQARSRNPFDSTKTNWSALHTFAHASHDSDVSLAEKIIEAGVSADAQLGGSVDLETPLLVAVKNNAFKLAGVLLRHGASIDAKFVSSGLITLEYPTTILGQVIASAARGSVTRVRFILTQCSALVSGRVGKETETVLIVEPERCLTAFHRAAWAHRGVFDRIPDGQSSPEAIQRGQFDFAQNRDIMYELLQHFGASKDHVNARTNDKFLRRTALHLAVDAINQAAVELMLDQETVDFSIEDANGHTALELALENARHPGIQCDGPCGLCPLPGRRWRCTICPDHDLCDACYRTSSSRSTEHNFNEVSLSETCAKIAARGKWCAAVPPEMEDLVKIINLLQSCQVRQNTREAMENLHV